jgi:hypothetical protein
MSTRLTDSQIERLIGERKQLPGDYRSRLRLREKRGHDEQELDIEGEGGSAFQIILRKNRINPLDFSVILGCFPELSGQLFRLRRYNGKSHEHTNQIERVTFYDFHIHQATERYQDLGLREDAWAVVTNQYGDFDGALAHMLSDCNFQLPEDPQQPLFGAQPW